MKNTSEFNIMDVIDNLPKDETLHNPQPRNKLCKERLNNIPMMSYNNLCDCGCHDTEDPDGLTPQDISFNHVLYYIRNKIAGIDIPDNVANLQDVNGLTLAMYYIRSLGKDVPKKLIHNPDLQDNCGWTIAMHYISLYHSVPPDWMIPSVNIQNQSGKNIAMFWLIYTKQPLLEWMYKCDPNMCDNCGNTIIDYYLVFTTEEIPERLLNEYTVNGNNETWQMSYIRIRKALPANLGPITKDIKSYANKYLDNVPEELALDTNKYFEDDDNPDDTELERMWAMGTFNKSASKKQIDPFIGEATKETDK